MNSKRLVAALAGAVLVAAMAANSSAQQKQPLFPDVVDASHASPQAKAFFHSLFTAKSAHKLEPLMAHFSKEKLTYIDAALGWPFYDYDALKKVFAEFMPLTLVAMVKLLLKFAAGVKVSAASKAFTSAIAPLALHTPVPAL